MLLNRILSKNVKLSINRAFHSNTLEYAKAATLSPLTYNKDSVQYKILSNALNKWVPKKGFTDEAITSSLNELDLSSSLFSVLGSSNSPSIFRSISPAVMELLKFQLVSKRYQLTENITPYIETAKDKLPSLETLLIERLKMDQPLNNQLSSLFNQLIIPSPLLFNVALPELFNLSDDLIYFSNEKDHHDMAWYAKRLGVSCAYVSSKLYMVKNNGENFDKTIDFAKDKLHRIMNLGEYYNNTEEYAWYTLMVSMNLVKARLARG
ncbi:ubiquinone biosynthesis protein COQ9 NDAI_0E04470 [Naumovozyma dairenensis CBS 421]|uniref:Ubiquinone biosynthesis protein n=1 Tax=Naumovozyma dairenensis (strain ATCC 10597 / BCRC 20456 / CBS 421 / NBRC 0211 / NRRL Y-12639) TaxID=1071378 RepID=G0WBZ4_NAUDC|nr:hypothetical protein NDAI_0E04470 [Naumovozyma dairenensis CBS 421]CCD25264.1 hypothetical protein NDAI_0E04470 [Naumovozyma dairenensis CBS 421]